ncbi:Hypothetical_protein [Hexamita inflata]|uniref:Hypothetical_protein n=1 Tax=Hexamita inflata TaxID=28002 RepID=A0AA86VSZ2_9EUKA|nr:Hypothetical protein HINF_LOCUS64368 [Hexamita inflata]
MKERTKHLITCFKNVELNRINSRSTKIQLTNFRNNLAAYFEAGTLLHRYWHIDITCAASNNEVEVSGYGLDLLNVDKSVYLFFGKIQTLNKIFDSFNKIQQTKHRIIGFKNTVFKECQQSTIKICSVIIWLNIFQ